jgi:hypothetical protein
MMDLGDPYSHGELVEAFAKVHREVEEFFASKNAEALFRRPEEDVWSPAENLLHLIRSVGPVASAMRYPKILLTLLFRRGKASRRFAEIREAYHAQLAAGGKAPKAFEPVLDVSGDATAAARERILEGWRRKSTSLVAAVEEWSEEQLDRYRLPHPLLGKLTVREMLLFTLYHDLHHVESVRRRSLKAK